MEQILACVGSSGSRKSDVGNVDNVKYRSNNANAEYMDKSTKTYKTIANNNAAPKIQ